MKDIVIVGAGGLGLETAWLIEENNKIRKEYRLLGYYDDNPQSANQSGMWIKYLGFIDKLLETNGEIYVVIAIANPRVKYQIYQKLSKNKHISFPNIISNRLELHKTNKIGFGNIIFSDTKITVNIQIGNFNLIAFNTTIGHGTYIGNYNSIYPAVTISGDVNIGNFTEIGTGSNIIQQIRLKDHSIVGAGTVVIKDVPGECTIVGSPGKLVCKVKK